MLYAYIKVVRYILTVTVTFFAFEKVCPFVGAVTEIPDVNKF